MTKKKKVFFNTKFYIFMATVKQFKKTFSILFISKHTKNIVNIMFIHENLSFVKFYEDQYMFARFEIVAFNSPDFLSSFKSSNKEWCICSKVAKISVFNVLVLWDVLSHTLIFLLLHLLIYNLRSFLLFHLM